MNNINPRKKLIWFLAVMAGLLGVFIYALEGGTETDNQTMVGERLPQFRLQSLANENVVVETRDISSGNPYLINVWASWCAACKTEHAFLMALKHQGINIIGLNYRDERKPALAVLSKLGNPFSQSIYDHQGSLALDLGVIGAPETFLIDANGKIVTRFSGVLDDSVWKERFVPYLSGEPK